MRWLGSLAASFASWLWACSPKPQDPLALPTQGHAVTFGVLMQVPPGAGLPRHVQALKKSRVRWIGLDIPLSRVDPDDGVYLWDYSDFEATLHALKAAGFRIALKFLGQADGISRAPHSAHADWDATLNLTPPREKAKWQRVVQQVVRRYGAYRDTWQIANEPDGGGYLRRTGWRCRLGYRQADRSPS